MQIKKSSAISREKEKMSKTGEWVVQSKMELDGTIVYEACHCVDGYVSQIIGSFLTAESASERIKDYLSSIEKRV